MRIVTIGWAVIVTVQVSGLACSQSAVPLAGDKFQNVTALHEMPADQMGKVMNIMSAALGVGCAHCHKGYDFASEDAAKKATARKMITMTLALNKDHFGGRTVVTCMTCHQGQAKPKSATESATLVATLPPAVLPPIAQPSVLRTEEPDNDVQHILDRFEQAVKSNTSQSAAASQTYQAERIEPTGKTEAVNITVVPGKQWKQVTRYQRVDVTESYVDKVAEKRAGESKLELKPDEAALIEIEAHLTLGLPLGALFTKWSVAERVVIDQQSMHVLQATDGELNHRFMFDESTGLLRRRTTSQPTVLGTHVLDVAYGDYQPRAGRQMPMKTTFSMPGVNWQIVIRAPKSP